MQSGFRRPGFLLERDNSRRDDEEPGVARKTPVRRFLVAYVRNVPSGSSARGYRLRRLLDQNVDPLCFEIIDASRDPQGAVGNHFLEEGTLSQSLHL